MVEHRVFMTPRLEEEARGVMLPRVPTKIACVFQSFVVPRELVFLRTVASSFVRHIAHFDVYRAKFLCLYAPEPIFTEVFTTKLHRHHCFCVLTNVVHL